MDPITSLHARPRAWLLHSVLAPHTDVFVSYLTRARYSVQSCGTYVASLAHLARWMSQCCLPLCQLDEAAVELFLTRHLPRCDCPRPVVRTRSALRAACAHLLKVLRERKVIAERAGATGPIAEELDRYDAHLREARGLSEGTRRSSLRLVQRLLRYKFADRPVVFAQPPHTIRHSTAMRLLQSGEHPDVIALWLGHENPTTTHHYVEADLSMKTRALARLQDPKAKTRRYRAPAALLEYLKGL